MYVELSKTEQKGVLVAMRPPLMTSQKYSTAKRFVQFLEQNSFLNAGFGFVSVFQKQNGLEITHFPTISSSIPRPDSLSALTVELAKQFM